MRISSNMPKPVQKVTKSCKHISIGIKAEDMWKTLNDSNGDKIFILQYCVGLKHNRILSEQKKTINPFALRAAKRGLTILEIICLQKHFLKNILRGNVNQKPNKNSPSKFL